ncbi:MAG: HAMP domain-containing sensor histidine kinase [Sediminibacterium sp.]|nr:HAMP domain-containing sensor histidine kinase [Sediminibacterium sp.]
MLKNSKSAVWLTLLFGYIIVQFLWWEILLVKQTGQIISEKQKLAGLSSVNSQIINTEVQKLQNKKTAQVIMIVGEGTVFLLLLLFGIYKIRQAHTREMKLNDQHRNFLLSITHELKTPLSAIKLQLQTLQKHQLNDSQKEELLKNALQENERLNSLIDNVLLVSRMDNGQSIVKPESTNLSKLVTEVVQRYYRAALQNNILTTDIEENIVLIADHLTFPSIITNLIDNSFKYSFNEKQVHLSLKKEKESVILRVSDRGCGIPEVDKAKIFDRFYRAGHEETRLTKGTGLGLYIVSYLVKAHNGSVTVENNQPSGSIFKLSFPIL